MKRLFLSVCLIATISVFFSCDQNQGEIQEFGRSVMADDGIYSRCSGTIITIDTPFEDNFDGLHLEISYDAHLASFQGKVQNKGSQKLCEVKVEVNMKDGTLFLGTSSSNQNIDLEPGESFDFSLSDQKYNPTGYQPTVKTKGPC